MPVLTRRQIAGFALSTKGPEFAERLRRSRSGFHAFCAMVDLLGVSETMRVDPHEASSRLNDMQGAAASLRLIVAGA